MLAAIRAFLRFYGRVITLALKHSYGRADAVGFLVAVGLMLLRKYLPERNWNVGEVQIVLMAFGVVFAARLVLAPFWLYQERDKLAVHTETALTEHIQKAQGLLAGKKAGRDLVNTLTLHYGEGSALLARSLAGELLPFSEISAWADKVNDTLAEHMSFSHRQEFALIVAHTFPKGFLYSDQRMAKNVGFVHTRLEKLLEFIKEARDRT
jgi:hypothetical protein